MRTADRLFRLAALAGLLSGCVTTPAPGPELGIDELLSGTALFGEVVTSAEAPETDVLGVDEAMRQFAHDAIADAPQAGIRLRRLITAMIDEGLLTLDYDPNLTHTAAETFHSRRGNCLSFTNLFVALAREVALEPNFQVVDIPPTWLSEGEFVVLNNHINVVVKDVRVSGNFVRDYVVDFNTAEFNGNYDTHVVDDDYAIALYYSNVAVEAMHRGADRLAFAYLLRGFAIHESVPGMWVNLGALYARRGHDSGAETAYRRALAIDPGNKSALANLAALYARTGRPDAAAYYEERVRYYRDRNPYYHYQLAAEAYREGRYDDALAALARAVQLKDDEHQFYYLRGLVHARMGDRRAAREDLKLAADYAQQSRLERAYNEKLEALRNGG